MCRVAISLSFVVFVVDFSLGHRRIRSPSQLGGIFATAAIRVPMSES